MHQDIESIKESIKAIEMRLSMVIDHLVLLNLQGKKIMATLDEVQTQVAAVADKVIALLSTITTENAEVVATLKKLTDQIAAGTPVNTAQLDALMSSLVAIGTNLDTANANIAALVPTPV